MKRKETIANSDKIRSKGHRPSPETFRRVLKYIGKNKVLFAVSAVLSVFIVALTLVMPVLIGRAIDLAVGQGNTDIPGIVRLLIIVGVMAAVSSVFQWLMSKVNFRVAYRVSHDLRNDAFRTIQNVPLSYIDTQAHGDVVSRVINDVDQFADGLLLGFSQLFVGVLTIVGTMGFIAAINWKIALVVLLLTPLSLFTARFIATRSYNMFRLQSRARGEQTAFTEEMISGAKVIKAFSHEKASLSDFDKINQRLSDYSFRATFLSSLTNPTTRFINSLVYASVALVGALSCVGLLGGSAAFTVGQLACLLSYTNQYTKPFNEISDVITEFQNALACVQRVFELIEQPRQTSDTASAVVLHDAQGNVSLRNVGFSYLPQRPLIEGLNLEVEKGQKIAIVGPTGCGKTTFINLLMRFYDVNDGEIRVDGTSVRDITRRSLRKSYGMVLQDSWLRYGTVEENIKIGKPTATREEVIEAAKKAHAHSFIKQLPHGYDTMITEEGGSLSAGQKQLLCIARIMLCLPPMLILDEATSSIDTRTEQKISSAFDEMTQGRTSFIVAHRLSTVREADVILVMRDGHIIEQGRHDELLSRNGFYAKLYMSQFAH